MTDLTQELYEALGSRLGGGGYDLVDLVPLKPGRAPGVKFQGLEEAIRQFESDRDGDLMTYVVQVRPAKKAAPAMAQATPAAEIAAPTAAPAATRAGQDPVYLADGSLNLPFLERNAQILLGAGETVLARNVYKTIMTSGGGGRTAVALMGIGRSFEVEGKLEEAVANYEESIAFHPSVEAFRRLASALVGLNKEQYAAEVLERASQQKEATDRERLEILKSAGQLRARLKDTARAEAHYRSALDLDPQSGDLRCSLAALFLQSGEVERARQAYEEATAADARSAQAWTGLGICCYTLGEKRKAYGHLVRALTIDLNSSSAVFYLLKCAFEIKRYKEAEVLLRNYVEITPVNVNLLYSLAGLQFHLGKFEACSKTAGRILSVRPEHKGASHLLQLVRERANAASPGR
ncbi:MAG TPA: tetratricopeptide repeat protein [Bdellovibrionota bacterium]|jgi:tetratricopeptide (TPR) repeat protein|nr:tetratricopeptide repeat protein [Bdellovibrionota bacterium]